MKKLQKIESKAKAIQAVLTSLLTGYLADPVYLIDKDLTGDAPGITLWMSSYDYRALVVLVNGTKVSALEVETNTVRVRREGEAPAGTEKFKYVCIG